MKREELNATIAPYTVEEIAGWGDVGVLRHWIATPLAKYALALEEKCARLAEDVKTAWHAEREVKEQAKRLDEAVKGLLAIVDDSRGVAGYHLNGDVAEWGTFEEVDAARNALAAKPGTCPHCLPIVGPELAARCPAPHNMIDAFNGNAPMPSPREDDAAAEITSFVLSGGFIDATYVWHGSVPMEPIKHNGNIAAAVREASRAAGVSGAPSADRNEHWIGCAQRYRPEASCSCGAATPAPVAQKVQDGIHLTRKQASDVVLALAHASEINPIYSKAYDIISEKLLDAAQAQEGKK